MYFQDARLTEEVTKLSCSRNQNIEKGKYLQPVAFGGECQISYWVLYHLQQCRMNQSPQTQDGKARLRLKSGYPIDHENKDLPSLTHHPS